jgi:HSP20 family protein
MPKKAKKEKENKKKEESDRPEKLAVREPAFWRPRDIMRSLDEDFREFRRDLERSLLWPTRWGAPIWMKYPQIDWSTTKQPLLDIKDTGKEIIIEAEMPGIPKENIEINVTENSIEISGKIKSEEEEEKEGYYRQERSYSTCYRQIPLPADVIPSKVDATLEDGILHIILPKKKPTAKKKGHKVKVK